MKQLELNCPCQTNAFIVQAGKLLKSMTSNIFILMLLQIQVRFCEKQIRLKASGLEGKRFGEYTLNYNSRKCKRFFGWEVKNFLAWFVYQHIHFKIFTMRWTANFEVCLQRRCWTWFFRTLNLLTLYYHIYYSMAKLLLILLIISDWRNSKCAILS